MEKLNELFLAASIDDRVINILTHDNAAHWDDAIGNCFSKSDHVRFNAKTFCAKISS